MDASKQTVMELFGGQHRYVVPPYQRKYVWTKDRQWLPLWDDIERLAERHRAGSSEPHFLGAVVIRREKTPPGGVTEWSVIDGQQRLTTLQLLLSAVADAARGDRHFKQARRIAPLTHHDEDVADGDERFKLWPAAANRAAFRHVMAVDGAEPSGDDEPADPSIRPAWEFFRARAQEYAQSGVAEGVEAGAERYRVLREALTGLVLVVTIDLEKEDPAQLIFETLNARGTPLLGMDLVKNALFDAAQKTGTSVEEVHDRYWRPQLGDDEYWGVEERLGRERVPRSETFLSHWLALRLGKPVATKGSFDTFRREVLTAESADPVELTRELNADAKVFRGFHDQPVGTVPARFFTTLRGLDTTTVYPLALLLLRPPSKLAPDRRDRALKAIESFLVRRLLCGLTTRDYNNLVARLVVAAKQDTREADDFVVEELLSSTADTSRWPTDDEMRQHLRVQPLYNWLGQKRIVFVLSAVELEARTGKVEAIDSLPPKLQIEHVMPRAWRDTWPLPSGASDEDRVRRDAVLDRLGNLTLVAGPLNASMSNGPWPVKRAALQKHSLLLLNRDIIQADSWDEARIGERGERLADQVLGRWPGPHSFMPEGWQACEAESWPEDADMDVAGTEAVQADGSPFLVALLSDLAQHVGERRTYTGIEASLDWPRGRLASVLGGYAVAFGPRFGKKRPWHVHLDGDGVWWMWMDEEHAAVVGKVD